MFLGDVCRLVFQCCGSVGQWSSEMFFFSVLGVACEAKRVTVVCGCGCFIVACVCGVLCELAKSI